MADEEHTETEHRVTPDTFTQAARSLHRKQPFPAGHKSEGYAGGVRDNGFVHKSVLGKGAFVGRLVGDGQYIVASMRRGTETVGRHAPRERVRQNEYVESEFRVVKYSGDLDDMDAIQAAFDSGEKIETGYIHGYRVTPFGKALDKAFAYYSDSETATELQES